MALNKCIIFTNNNTNNNNTAHKHLNTQVAYGSANALFSNISGESLTENHLIDQIKTLSLNNFYDTTSLYRPLNNEFNHNKKAGG